MILRIAISSGRPPSWIAAHWTPQELQEAEILQDIEGYGTEQQQTGRICAELHNAVREYAIAKKVYAPETKKFLDEDFVPKRVRKEQKTNRAAVAKKLFSYFSQTYGSPKQ